MCQADLKQTVEAAVADHRASCGGQAPVLLLLQEGAPDLADALQAHAAQLHAAGVVCIMGDNRGLTAEEVGMLEQMAAVPDSGLVVVPASLGATPLLASQCIVLAQHYLDRYVHTCELPPAAGRLVVDRDLARTRSEVYTEFFNENGADQAS